MSRTILPLLLTLTVTTAAIYQEPKPNVDSSAMNVPPGFVVEKVAESPLVEHPMFACFDEAGRLYVAEAAGVNLRADDLLKQTPNRILRLEDANGDGIFDKSIVFADKMTLPMGVLWNQGALYTASPPSFWKLEDTDGDGKADKRTELVTRFNFTGNAADVHGPFLGPDGRLYWCDGRHGHDIKGPDGKSMKGKAARIFRCKPDGSEVEVVCGGGMDNPVEVAFTDEGEPIATCNIMMPRPRVDTLFHCIEGGVWPWHDALNEFPRTGELLPPVVELGWVAPSGLMRYRSDVFGKTYRDNLFSAQFNRHRIQRHVLTRDGATFKATSEDFLTSDNKDFHSTDVLEDADGSMLVVDTGGWFRIGCPTSQIAKPDIKGAIYRIRRKDAPRIADPRGVRIPWSRWNVVEFCTLLDDARPAVRDRAIEELARMGDKATVALKGIMTGKNSTLRRRNAVWTLTRIGTLVAKEVLLSVAIKDSEATIRQAATHSLGLLRYEEAANSLLNMAVSDDSPAIRRDAATALGRLKGSEKAARVLMESLKNTPDRFGEHAILYALIRMGQRETMLKGLDHANTQVRRGSLIVLDQMANGDLSQHHVIPLLSSNDSTLQRTALNIVSRRPDWASDVVGLLRQWLGETKPDLRRRESLRSALLALGKTEAIQTLLAEVLMQEKTPNESRVLALEMMARLPPPKLPESWLPALQRSIGAKDNAVVLQTIAATEANKLKDLDGALQGLAGQKMRPSGVRVAALSVIAPRLERTQEAWLDFLLTQVSADVPPLERLSAAQALSRLPLDLLQLDRLTRIVAEAGPMELPYLLKPFEGKTNPAIGKKLLLALRGAKGFDALSADDLRRVVQSYPAEVKSGAMPLLLTIEARLNQQRGKLRQLESLLTLGDVRRGRDLFFGKKIACAACHTVRGEGEKTGPDLSTIGAIRPGRDLLESLVVPSASFVRGFEPYNVTTIAGKSYMGILLRESAESITLLTTDRTEARISRGDIETFEPGKVSIMPQGLDTQMTKEELRDLLSYLQSLR